MGCGAKRLFFGGGGVGMRGEKNWGRIFSIRVGTRIKLVGDRNFFGGVKFFFSQNPDEIIFLSTNSLRS